jgi:iron complex transport system substrate-binding protein
MRIRRRRAPPAAAALLLVAAGCLSRSPEPTGRVVADGLGRQVSLPREPRRLVSLAPSVTETLFALGLGDRVVGISDFCEPPPSAGPIPRVGGMLNPSLEAIKALRPDLLIATTSGNDPSLASQAEALALPLYVLDAPDVESTLRGLESLAKALGAPESGRTLADDLRGRLAAIAARVERHRPPRVLFIVWGEPLVVPGKAAFVTDALRRAGGASVTAGAPGAWPAFDLEAAVASAPEVILMTKENRPLAERLPGDPAWTTVPAVRRGRIRIVSDAIQRPGPRVVDGIEEVARALHPEEFRGEGPPRGAEESRANRGGPHGGGIGVGHPSAHPSDGWNSPISAGGRKGDRGNFRCIGAAGEAGQKAPAPGGAPGATGGIHGVP